MLEFQEKRRFFRALYSKPALIALLILLFVLFRTTWDVYAKQSESTSRLAVSRRQLAALEERESMLQSEIERLGTARGIEEEIRSKFRVVKPGEKAVVILDPEDVDATSAPKTDKGFFSWFKDLFSH